MSLPLRVAACQSVAVAGDIAGNAATAGRLVARAAHAGADLAVLPELFLPGYDVPGLRADTGRDVDAAALGSDRRLDPLRAACRDGGVVAVVGASLRRGDHRRLAVLLVDGAGTVSAPYDKQHLWGDEPEVFSAGDRGAVVDVGRWPVGLGVCYDGCFPEHARAAALAGALAYACPAAFVLGSEHRRDLYYRARAIDNGMYVVLAGLVGPGGHRVFTGGSAVLDPEGRVIVQVGEEPEAVLVAELDPGLVASTRAAHPMLAEIGAERSRLSGTGPPVSGEFPRTG